MRVAPIALLATAVVVLPAGGGAAAQQRKGPTLFQSKRLWATVNVCNTVEHPNTVGIRASMPGSGRKGERMYMRFQVQFFRPADNGWHNLGSGGDSGFVPVGHARYKRREAGRNFVLNPPAAGQEFLVRGAVTFEWRRGDQVMRRVRKRTTSGHPGTVGADPPAFSAANCTIRS